MTAAPYGETEATSSFASLVRSGEASVPSLQGCSSKFCEVPFELPGVETCDFGAPPRISLSLGEKRRGRVNSGPEARDGT